MNKINLLATCAKYGDCWSCVGDRGCGYFYKTEECVPGGWLSPHENYTDTGNAWNYYHGNCYASTRVEFVLLPSICGLIALALAIVALWRSCPIWWCELFDSSPSPCTSPHAGVDVIGYRHQHLLEEHVPLLIDNDPGSRTHVSQTSNNIHNLSQPAPITTPSSPGNRRDKPLVAGTSLEEHYGSWCQRSGHMVQGNESSSG
ncbi:hypothetical protein COEREDRAFT_8039 [Coemansia reversa NRRL 1564]|uniref:PSI domain-containing protein n=1 Tax=Coemansia reversa (strain ATCC 12441 / NRRL 1564) TaxID=763665 RepID=A0A2G5BD12_COERN|nr:hypothetical protein COEREDRAFT_8039 [Coemansia reversa NRRL 1564]|eukprot:PIA16893.1 hypothetical protein COEREDRAFT_8039 [Coemansia reversa NRRL 1564]